MKKIYFVMGSFLFPLLAMASDIDDFINENLSPITHQVENIVFWQIPLTDETGIPFVLVWLIAGAIFFTVYMNFVNITKFKLAIDVVRGKYTDPNEPGEVSHFQALATALSGTVGLGNIAGVAIAISIGGPGATLWMIIAGLLGMSTKFAECTLGVKYRNVDENGVVHGGPMYYLRRGLEARGLTGLGRFFAAFFAIMCIGGAFGGGNMFQINQAYKQFSAIAPGFLNTPGWIFGFFMAILVGIVIIGGIKSIARVTDKIVPFMCVLYVLAALVVIIVNYHHIPSAFGIIWEGAFMPDAALGGILGVMIQGFRRAAFSNEAGIGSASIAHSAVRTNNPASEGIVALLEPFIDTVVICTMTALVIVISDTYLQFAGDTSTSAGVRLTSMAFGTVISWFPYVLSLAVILFAFSTMISWSYYGLQSWQYLFGRSMMKDNIFKFIFCLFVIIGAAAEMDAVIGFSDAMIFAMCFPNIFGLYILRKEIKDELGSYLGKIKSGEIIAHK